MDNIVIEEGTIRREIHTHVNKYSDSTKKDKISETKTDNVVIFKDKDRNEYPDGKIIKSDEYVTLYDYDYTKDGDGNTISCKITKSKAKNGKSLDFEKTTSNKYYDIDGKLIKEEFLTRDGIVYLKQRYEYNSDNGIEKRIDKSTDTVQTITYNNIGEVVCITSETIKSKVSFTKYRAYFDNKGRIYKTIDGDKSIETDYEREFNGDGNILSETKRFFELFGTSRKLISYVTEMYNPAAGYKLDSVIKNGILTEKHEYDLKGDELKMYKIEDGKEIFTRTEKSIDSDTGNITKITNTKIVEQCSCKCIKDITIKTIVDKDGKLLLYSENNSIVQTYEYDEEERRTSVITKKLIDEEFAIINRIEYTYETEQESGKTTKTRKLTVYDDKGNIKEKTIQSEIVDVDTDTWVYDITEFESKEEDTKE